LRRDGYAPTQSAYLAIDHIEVYKINGTDIMAPFDQTGSTDEAITTETEITTTTSAPTTTTTSTTKSPLATTKELENSTYSIVYSCDFDENDCGGVPTPSFDLNAGGVYFNLFSSFTHTSFRSLSDVTSISNTLLLKQ
jgi:hypothetical protein